MSALDDRAALLEEIQRESCWRVPKDGGKRFVMPFIGKVVDGKVLRMAGDGEQDGPFYTGVALAGVVLKVATEFTDDGDVPLSDAGYLADLLDTVIDCLDVSSAQRSVDQYVGLFFGLHYVAEYLPSVERCLEVVGRQNRLPRLRGRLVSFIDHIYKYNGFNILSGGRGGTGLFLPLVPWYVETFSPRSRVLRWLLKALNWLIFGVVTRACGYLPKPENDLFRACFRSVADGLVKVPTETLSKTPAGMRYLARKDNEALIDTSVVLRFLVRLNGLRVSKTFSVFKATLDKRYIYSRVGLNLKIMALSVMPDTMAVRDIKSRLIDGYGFNIATVPFWQLVIIGREEIARWTRNDHETRLMAYRLPCIDAERIYVPKCCGLIQALKYDGRLKTVAYCPIPLSEQIYHSFLPISNPYDPVVGDFGRPGEYASTVSWLWSYWRLKAYKAIAARAYTSSASYYRPKLTGHMPEPEPPVPVETPDRLVPASPSSESASGAVTLDRTIDAPVSAPVNSVDASPTGPASGAVTIGT